MRPGLLAIGQLWHQHSRFLAGTALTAVLLGILALGLPGWQEAAEAMFGGPPSLLPAEVEPGSQVALEGVVEPFSRPREDATLLNSLPVLPLGLAGGLLGGLLLAWRRMWGHTGFTSAEALVAGTGLPCSGTLPCLPRRAALETAAQEICAHLNLFHTGGEGRVVLVTSALPGEGKSFLCQALAETLAAAGQRVLLMDAEARCPPHLAAEKGIDPGADGGLVVVHDRPVFGSVMDILRLGNFAQFLDDARLHYDIILLAGAPLLRSSDSLILGRMSDAVVPVVRCAATPRPLVHAALRRLQDDSIMIDGVVLNERTSRRGAALHADKGHASPASHPQPHRQRPDRPFFRSQ